MNKLIYEAIDNRYIRLVEPFMFEQIEVPVCFVCDLESIPLFKGSSKRGGVIHDYLCRKDSVPLVSKKVAAEIYLRVMAYREEVRQERIKRIWSSSEKKPRVKDKVVEQGTRLRYWCGRYLKYWVVRVAWGYFHKFKVMATYEEIKNGQ